MGRMRLDAYHARSARGLEESTRPMVLGRVPCSSPYAMPFSRHARPFLTAACSAAVSWESSGMLTIRIMFTSESAHSLPFNARGGRGAYSERQRTRHSLELVASLQYFQYLLPAQDTSRSLNSSSVDP